jgi:hypothetical protein
MSACEIGQPEGDSFEFRLRAYRAVAAVVSDDNNHERGIDEARTVVAAVLADTGPAGLAEFAVELSSQLGAALERIAAENGLTAFDLAEVWFLI